MADRNRALIFAPSKIATAARIARMIDRDPASRTASCTICTDPAALRQQLTASAVPAGFAVLLAASRRELELMVSLAPWFEGRTCIIMVPDHMRKTIALAHRLRPRYLMWPKTNGREMRLILRHIIARHPDRRRTGLPSAVPMLIGPPVTRCGFLLRRSKSRRGGKGAACRRNTCKSANEVNRRKKGRRTADRHTSSADTALQRIHTMKHLKESKP